MDSVKDSDGRINEMKLALTPGPRSPLGKDCGWPRTSWSCKFCTNACLRRVDEDGRSAGSLWKHFWRKSFPTDDKVSGMGGDSCSALNMAEA